MVVSLNSRLESIKEGEEGGARNLVVAGPSLAGRVLVLRLVDSCITELKAQGPSRTCNESKEEEEEGGARNRVVAGPGLSLALPLALSPFTHS